MLNYNKLYVNVILTHVRYIIFITIIIIIHSNEKVENTNKISEKVINICDKSGYTITIAIRVWCRPRARRLRPEATAISDQNHLLDLQISRHRSLSLSSSLLSYRILNRLERIRVSESPPVRADAPFYCRATILLVPSAAFAFSPLDPRSRRTGSQSLFSRFTVRLLAISARRIDQRDFVISQDRVCILLSIVFCVFTLFEQGFIRASGGVFREEIEIARLYIFRAEIYIFACACVAHRSRKLIVIIKNVQSIIYIIT